jgi:MFS family permease
MALSDLALRRQALKLILLFGIVSFMGDITYEGARGVSGPYLALLGASAAVVGLVAGLGECLGYVLRVVAGYLADRLRSYWLLIFVGYASLLSIPALALAASWPAAALLLTVERLGKGLRSPARDAILSYAASRVGRGFGFGLHEALDQAGALIGPLLFAAVIALEGEPGYRSGFLLLLGPVAIALTTLSGAWHSERKIDRLEPRAGERSRGSSWGSLSSAFWRYVLFSSLAVAGLVQFPLIAYHLGRGEMLAVQWIPLLYAIGMGVDGLVAVFAGLAYDRTGLESLLLVPVLTAAMTVLVLTMEMHLIVLGIVIWGIVMGLVETTMRAAVGDLSPVGARGLAYGVFNTGVGVSLLVGGTAMGWLYQFGTWWVVFFACGLELLALGSFLWLKPSVSRPRLE